MTDKAGYTGDSYRISRGPSPRVDIVRTDDTNFALLRFMDGDFDVNVTQISIGVQGGTRGFCIYVDDPQIDPTPETFLHIEEGMWGIGEGFTTFDEQDVSFPGTVLASIVPADAEFYGQKIVHIRAIAGGLNTGIVIDQAGTSATTFNLGGFIDFIHENIDTQLFSTESRIVRFQIEAVPRGANKTGSFALKMIDDNLNTVLFTSFDVNMNNGFMFMDSGVSNHPFVDTLFGGETLAYNTYYRYISNTNISVTLPQVSATGRDHIGAEITISNRAGVGSAKVTVFPSIGTIDGAASFDVFKGNNATFKVFATSIWLVSSS